MILVHKNVTKAYRKTSKNVPNVVISVDRKVAEKLLLDDPIEVSANTGDVFITMKDHKPDFLNNPTCGLTNPSKSEIGIISKQILDNRNKKAINAMQVNQWKSTSNAIEWFKAQHAFITFDVWDLYPLISEQLPMKALDYASQFTTITQQDRHTITHLIKSLLYRQQLSWTKKNTDNMFDVIMGSYDGAETCELIGTYMLSLITAKIKDQLGLYRDDGLAVCEAMPRQIEKRKQQLSNLLISNGLKQKKNSS